MQSQNKPLFDYLNNNPEAVKKVFHFFSQYNLNNQEDMLAGNHPYAQSTAFDYRMTKWAYNLLLNPNPFFGRTGLPFNFLYTLINNPEALVDLYQADINGSAGAFKVQNIDVSSVLKFPKFKLLYELFMEGNFSLFNRTIRPFASSNGLDLIFKDCSQGTKYCDDGYTDDDTLDNEGEIVIYVECNSNPLQLAETILHEGIHAAVLDFMCNGKNACTSLENPMELLKLYKRYSNNANLSDHVFIGKYYIEKIGKTLAQLDGNQYPDYYYYGLTYEGIEYWLNSFTPSDKHLIERYSKFKQYNKLVKENTILGK